METWVRDGGQRKVNHTFVRSKPAEGWIICQPSRDAPKVCHQLFNSNAGEWLGEHLDRFPPEFVAVAQRECDPGSPKAVLPPPAPHPQTSFRILLNRLLTPPPTPPNPPTL